MLPPGAAAFLVRDVAEGMGAYVGRNRRSEHSTGPAVGLVTPRVYHPLADRVVRRAHGVADA